MSELEIINQKSLELQNSSLVLPCYTVFVLSRSLTVNILDRQ
jgi:hypothetical protein